MSTAVYVVYATRVLDLRWIPSDTEVIIVHNDDSLDRRSIERQRVIHLEPGHNIGFGAAVNLALDSVTSDRIVLCNPDTTLQPAHWVALATDCSPGDVATVPLVDASGAPTSVSSAYPTAVTHLASGLRLGRYLPRRGRARRVLTPWLGRWGRAHGESLTRPAGVWPLRERWISGALMSLDVGRMRAVGGFDPAYFLYYEDVDLCRRLARDDPHARAVVVDVEPGIHRVGASATTAVDERAVGRIRLESAVHYASTQTGWSWRVCERILRARRTRA
jgi:GT2 family glycosyltransferase